MEKKFNYSSDEKGLLLASFFIGYIFLQVNNSAVYRFYDQQRSLTVLQIPGGWVASTFGAKWVLGGGMFIAGVFTLLLPVAAEVIIKSFLFSSLLLVLDGPNAYLVLQNRSTYGWLC